MTALKSLGSLEGRTVINITYPLTSNYMGLTLGFDAPATEEIAKAMPGAAVVKAFNIVLEQALTEGPTFSDGQTVPVFYASDDERAKQTRPCFGRKH